MALCSYRFNFVFWGGSCRLKATGTPTELPGLGTLSPLQLCSVFICEIALGRWGLQKRPAKMNTGVLAVGGCFGDASSREGQWQFACASLLDGLSCHHGSLSYGGTRRGYASKTSAQRMRGATNGTHHNRPSIKQFVRHFQADKENTLHTLSPGILSSVV